MTCAACSSETRTFRLPLDRASLALCPCCGHGSTVKAPARLGARAYGANGQALAVYERAYLPSRLNSYRRGLELLGDPAGRSLLDYGCYYGHFLALAARRGWRVRGFEPAPALPALPEVRAQVAASLDGAAAGARFDAVTLWDVLEHLDSPGDQLGKIRAHLRPGGRLLVRVPDARALGLLTSAVPLRVVSHPYLAFAHPTNPEEHLHHFSPRSLELIARAAGFRRVALIEAEPDERVAAGRDFVDAVARRALHRAGRRVPYEFTMVLEAGG